NCRTAPLWVSRASRGGNNSSRICSAVRNSILNPPCDELSYLDAKSCPRQPFRNHVSPEVAEGKKMPPESSESPEALVSVFACRFTSLRYVLEVLHRQS